LRTDSVLVRRVCESRGEGTVEHTKGLEVANAAAIYCLTWTHSAETTTPSHTSLPSLRRAQGRVKLSAFTCMQRCGITKLARLGATHPVVRIKNIDPSRANLSIISLPQSNPLMRILGCKATHYSNQGGRLRLSDGSARVAT